MFLLIGAGGKFYVVSYDGAEYTCTCPDFLFRHRECKHIRAVKNAKTVFGDVLFEVVE